MLDVVAVFAVLNRMLRVSLTANTLLDAVVILACAASKKHQLELPAGLCQQAVDVPAALAEPAAAPSVLAEVGYLCLCEQDSRSQPYCAER